MPIQAPSWTDFLNCPICCNEFAAIQRVPISLGCGHTICKLCLTTLYNRQCPFDQTLPVTDIENLPINNALLQLVGNGAAVCPVKASSSKESELADLSQNVPSSVQELSPEDLKCYKLGKECIEDLALYLKSFLNNGNLLTRPMQRKLVTLVNCQLVEEEGRVRALRAARSLGERTVTELILQHQNPQQLSSNLWAAVRTRGCQFLGPAMQEEVLKLVLLALEEGSALSRKVLVMFVVQRLEPHFPQASKTSIGHVVQLLYRASCFKVSKREADSSLMQLKEEFRTYDALRREHDAQIVQIATEAGLRIAPEQWSSLLYGDISHKSHMQSIIDKLQTPSSFAQSVQELVIALQRTNDPAKLSSIHDYFQYLARIDPCIETAQWDVVAKALDAVKQAVVGLVHFLQHHGVRKPQDNIGGGTANTSNKYKISLCRDLNARRVCPRGSSCTFAHSEEELERYRARNRAKHLKAPLPSIPAINHMVGNSKKSMNMGEESSPHRGPILPMSPMRYMQTANIGNRGFVEPNCTIPSHSQSSGSSHPPQQLIHPHHSPISHKTTGLNGLLPPSPYEPRFNFAATPTQSVGPPGHTIPQSRNSNLDFHAHSGNLQQQPQHNVTTAINPPNFNVNSNIHNHATTMAKNLFPSDVYQTHPAYFRNECAGSNACNNNVELAGKLHSGTPSMWDHSFLPPQQPTMGPSSKHSNRPMSIITATSDTSFFEKKPPNNINISLDINKQLSEIALEVDAMSMPADSYNRPKNTNSFSFWNSNKTLAEGNNDKHSFRDTSNFVRSDSILDDDASTFDMPSGSSMGSPYGPICPKRSIPPTNWNNWIIENDSTINPEFLSNNNTRVTDVNYTVFPASTHNKRSIQLQPIQNEAKAAGNISRFNFNNVNVADARLKSSKIVVSNDNANINKVNVIMYLSGKVM
ncbi:roquin-1 isoform X2 [Scaptodrosophila lebanonensis]|uniref:RING-type E3 ubiquitin transferase n=1 Tax=Drosophila lebanonensis TaxID=7225 RepID=A0A6J2TJ26_DROLE|nr:roquin-1 isoform X2 [Scaptodrosophila lebanonensis]